MTRWKIVFTHTKNEVVGSDDHKKNKSTKIEIRLRRAMKSQ